MKVKSWKVEWKHEKSVGRHKNGHPMYPDEWRGSLRLVEQLVKDPPPCIECPLKQTCAENEIACREFFHYVNHNEIKWWSKGSKGSGYSRVPVFMRELFASADDGPNKEWFEGIYLS